MTAINSHLSSAELDHRYKTASEAIAKSHFRGRTRSSWLDAAFAGMTWALKFR